MRELDFAVLGTLDSFVDMERQRDLIEQLLASDIGPTPIGTTHSGGRCLDEFDFPASFDELNQDDSR